MLSECPARESHEFCLPCKAGMFQTMPGSLFACDGPESLRPHKYNSCRRRCRDENTDNKGIVRSMAVLFESWAFIDQFIIIITSRGICRTSYFHFTHLVSVALYLPYISVFGESLFGKFQKTTTSVDVVGGGWPNENKDWCNIGCHHWKCKAMRVLNLWLCERPKCSVHSNNSRAFHGVPPIPARPPFPSFYFTIPVSSFVFSLISIDFTAFAFDSVNNLSLNLF